MRQSQTILIFPHFITISIFALLRLTVHGWKNVNGEHYLKGNAELYVDELGFCVFSHCSEKDIRIIVRIFSKRPLFESFDYPRFFQYESCSYSPKNVLWLMEKGFSQLYHSRIKRFPDLGTGNHLSVMVDQILSMYALYNTTQLSQAETYYQQLLVLLKRREKHSWIYSPFIMILQTLSIVSTIIISYLIGKYDGSMFALLTVGVFGFAINALNKLSD